MSIPRRQAAAVPAAARWMQIGLVAGILCSSLIVATPSFMEADVLGQDASAEEAPLAPTGIQGLITAGSIVAAAESEIGEVWPGSWWPGKPFVLTVPEEYVLIYTTREAPDGYAPVPDQNAGIGSFHTAAGVQPDMAASKGFMDIRYELAGEVATAVPLKDGLVETLRFLFHEAFHAFQDSAFANRTPSYAGVPTEMVTTPEYRALADVERRILARMLDATDRRVLDRLAGQYLVVRDHRLGMVSERAVAVEREMERIEGSATLVSYLAANRALGKPEDEVAGIISEHLRMPIEVSAYGGSWNIRSRIYATGAAIGLVLNRLAPGWESAMEAGLTFERLLRRAVPPPPADRAPLLRRTLEEFGYATLLRQVGSISLRVRPCD